MGRQWWFEVEGETNVYVYNKDGRMKIVGDHNKSCYLSVSEIRELSVEEKERIKNRNYTEPLKIFCAGGKQKFYVDKYNFDHTKTPFSRKFAKLGMPDFIKLVTLELTRMSEEKGKKRKSVSGTSSSVYEYSDDDATQVNSSSSSSDSTPPPALRSEKKPVKDSEEDAIRKTIRDAEIDGVHSVALVQLQPGEMYLRETSDTWKQEIARSMKTNPFVRGPPLVAIADCSKAEFNKERPNIHTYIVVGGCHQLAAVNQLNKEDPNNNRYKTRDVHVYSKELLDNDTAVSWLANKHNQIQGMHLKVTTEDKVKYCRNQFLKEDNTNWQQNCRVVLRMKNDTPSRVILDLASLPADVFQCLEDVYEAYSNGEIIGMKSLTAEEINNGGDFKSYHFSDFSRMTDRGYQEVLLKDLADGSSSIKEFCQECKLTNKKRDAQKAFMREVGVKDWKDAVHEYPLHTTTKAFDRFMGLNFKRTLPEVWRTHIMSAKRFKEGKDTELPPQSYVLDSVCYVTTTDIKLMTKSTMEKQFKKFTGADIVMLHIEPEGVKSFSIKDVVAINLDMDQTNFMLLVWADVTDVGTICSKLGDCDHVEVVYTNTLPGKMKGGKGLLHSSIKPVVVAYWSTSKVMPSPTTCLVTRRPDSSNLFTATDEVSLMRQIIETFSSKDQWILTVNLQDNAATALAALDTGRNCICAVKTDDAAKNTHTELNKLVMRKELAKEKSATLTSKPNAEISTNDGEESNQAANQMEAGTRNADNDSFDPRLDSSQRSPESSRHSNDEDEDEDDDDDAMITD